MCRYGFFLPHEAFQFTSRFCTDIKWYCWLTTSSDLVQLKCKITKCWSLIFGECCPLKYLLTSKSKISLISTFVYFALLINPHMWAGMSLKKSSSFQMECTMNYLLILISVYAGVVQWNTYSISLHFLWLIFAVPSVELQERIEAAALVSLKRRLPRVSYSHHKIILFAIPSLYRTESPSIL